MPINIAVLGMCPSLSIKVYFPENLKILQSFSNYMFHRILLVNTVATRLPKTPFSATVATSLARKPTLIMFKMFIR